MKGFLTTVGWVFIGIGLGVSYHVGGWKLLTVVICVAFGVMLVLTMEMMEATEEKFFVWNLIWLAWSKNNQLTSLPYFSRKWPYVEMGPTHFAAWRPMFWKFWWRVHRQDHNGQTWHAVPNKYNTVWLGDQIGK